jgi:hypothetical protein
MIHLNAYNTSYSQKKGQESKCQFDSQPLKVKNNLKLHACRWHATYRWKAFDKAYNFSLDFASIRGFNKNLWASKMARVPILRISRLPTWESLKKWHLGVAPMANHWEYYKGEGDSLPQVRVVMSLVSPCMPLVHPCTESVPIMH